MTLSTGACDRGTRGYSGIVSTCHLKGGMCEILRGISLVQRLMVDDTTCSVAHLRSTAQRLEANTF